MAHVALSKHTKGGGTYSILMLMILQGKPHAMPNNDCTNCILYTFSLQVVVLLAQKQTSKCVQ